MRPLAMLRRRPIAILWTGQVLSCTGDYFYGIAVMWIAAKLVGGAAGLVAASQSIAALTMSTFGGVVADRLDRRRVMMAADVGRALAVATLPVIAWFRPLGLVDLVLVAIALGSLDAMFTPSLHASVPSLVEHPGELHATNGLMDVTRRLARAIGPSLAGAVAAVVSIPHFFTIDALSFGVSAIALYAIGPRYTWRAEPRSTRLPFQREIAEAIALVRGHAPVLWALGALFVVNVTWCAGFYVGSALFASRILNQNVGSYGLIIGAYGVGNIGGNVIATSMHMKRRVFAIFGAKLILCAGFLVLAMAPSLPIAMLGAAIAAIGGPLGELPLVSMLQTEFGTTRTGRLFALRMLVEQGGVAVGMAASAPLFALVPIRVAIAGCAIAMGMAGVAGLVKFGVRS